MDTASEALAVSLGERARVDLTYMSELTGKSEEEVAKELARVIFQNPVTEKWETADEYLSGNVRRSWQPQGYLQRTVQSLQSMSQLLRAFSPRSLMQARLRCVSVPHGLSLSTSRISCGNL